MCLMLYIGIFFFSYGDETQPRHTVEGGKSEAEGTLSGKMGRIRLLVHKKELSHILQQKSSKINTQTCDWGESSEPFKSKA